MLRTIGRKLLSQHDIAKLPTCRTLTHYPIDETIFGLSDDQIQVNNIQCPVKSKLKHLIFDFKKKLIATSVNTFQMAATTDDFQFRTKRTGTACTRHRSQK